jgi:hypothetical protein
VNQLGAPYRLERMIYGVRGVYEVRVMENTIIEWTSELESALA